MLPANGRVLDSLYTQRTIHWTLKHSLADKEWVCHIGLTGAACGPFMRSTCRDWRGPRLAASSQVMPSNVAARKLEAASAHSARAAPLAAHASRASSTSKGVSSFSCP